MSSSILRPASTALYRLSSNRLLGCRGTFERLSFSSCSRSVVHHHHGSVWFSSRLNEQRWSSTNYRTSLPGFCNRVSKFVGRNIGAGPWNATTIRRPISVTARHCAKKTEFVTVHFINRDGEKITVKGKIGDNLLDTVVDNDLDIDGYGACEGTLSCSTCHLIFAEDLFRELPKPSDEELDMLDLAYGQTDLSRLGCQVILTKEMDGMTVVVPEGVADARDV